MTVIFSLKRRQPPLSPLISEYLDFSLRIYAPCVCLPSHFPLSFSSFLQHGPSAWDLLQTSCYISLLMYKKSSAPEGGLFQFARLVHPSPISAYSLLKAIFLPSKEHLFCLLLSQANDGDLFRAFNDNNSPLWHICYRFAISVLDDSVEHDETWIVKVMLQDLLELTFFFFFLNLFLWGIYIHQNTTCLKDALAQKDLYNFLCGTYYVICK